MYASRIVPDDSSSIFRQTMGSDAGLSARLSNPCSAQPTPAIYADAEVLEVRGRRRVLEVKAFAGNTLAGLRNLKNMMVGEMNL